MAVSLLLKRSVSGLMPLPMAVYTDAGSFGIAEGDLFALGSLTSLVPPDGDNQPSVPEYSGPMVFAGPCKVLCHANEMASCHSVFVLCHAVLCFT